MKKIIVEFADSNTANDFRDEMRKRFHYPKTQSKYEVVKGHDENGNTVFVDSSRKAGVFSKVILSGFFSYCVDDANGECQEFDTLAEAKRFAKQHSKENPDQEFNIYGMSSFIYMNGKETE